MQSLTVQAGRNPAGHSPAEILTALQAPGGSRRFSFRYELLDKAGSVVGPLDGVLSCKITQNWLADIKRTASLLIREGGGIDYLSDRVKPYVRLHLPPYGPSDWVEWAQGVFMLSSPKRHLSAAGEVTREVAAYDLLQVYADDKPDWRYTFFAGQPYISQIVNILGPIPKRVTPSAALVPVTRDWDVGTSRLTIINAMLSALNYESLSFDEEGVAVLQPYRSPAERQEEYVYATDRAGLIVPEVDQELDLFSIANKWVLVVSEPDRAPIVARYTNSDPSSPTSTVRRGRTITDFRQEQEAVDQTTLNAKAARVAFEASQVYEAIDFSTGLMPIHSGNDVYRIAHDRLAVNAKYAEHSWEMELKVGVPMKHRARRVVTV